MASTTSAAASATSSAASGTFTVPSNLKVIGIILAISSGALIGTSFVFKKKGLLRSQKGMVAGEGVAYLKSPLWWLGMTMMILGEICNFVAYAFVEAIVVTPMGALSVVICAILSSIFLKEKLSFFGWIGCALCILGSVIIALNGPQEPSVGQITQFQKLFLAPGFLAYGSVLIVSAIVIVLFVAPRYGKQNMLWYIMVCSMIGGISVSVTTGLGSAIVTSVMGDNQFKHWFTYFLMAFVAVTLITEVYYLNVALALFNTAMVTPTYYVIFTFFSMLTTIVLFQGLKAPVLQIITLVLGFLVICFGITILQLSKIDPTQIKQLDRRSTILLQAARSNTEGIDEKDLTAIEDPGMDALRGGFGMIGSVIRARSARRMSMSSGAGGSIRSRYSGMPPIPPLPQHVSFSQGYGTDSLAGLKRHQLWDAPVPRVDDAADNASDFISLAGTVSPLSTTRKQTIKFDNQEVVHQYHTPGLGDNTATHERRAASHNGGAPSFDFDAKDAPGVQVLTLPIFESHESDDLSGDDSSELAPRTAPPALGNSTGAGAGAYQPPPPFDPFENSPSTARAASFAHTFDAPDVRPESAHQHHSLQLWGRGGHTRRYPPGQMEEDREQSESLWHEPFDEEDGAAIPHGGIRLVSSSRL